EYVRTDGVYAACLDGTIDFGIVAQPLRRRQIEVIPLRPEVLVVVCSPEHPLARRREVRLERLAGEPLGALDRGGRTRRVVDRLVKRHGASGRVVTESDNVGTIKRSGEAGRGVSILPENSVKNEVKLRSLGAISP